MVDSISSNLPAPMAVPGTGAHAPERPEPAVQVTGAAAARNGGDAASYRNGAGTNSGSAVKPEEAFEEINSAMQAWATGMRFELDEDTQRLVVSIIDTQSGDVLRQIPSEEVLHVAKMIAQFQGNFVSTKA